jgi:hypothetical protein
MDRWNLRQMTKGLPGCRKTWEQQALKAAKEMFEEEIERQRFLQNLYSEMAS